MAAIAQTNLALYQQLQRCAYPEAEREQVAAAYRLAMRMFAGLYRGSEKPFLAHLVGTASILAEQRAPVAMVTAGLLHAAYMAGDFGYQPRLRATARKRRQLAADIGAEAEALIAAYTDFRWDAAAVAGYRDRGEQLTALERQLLQLRLANELEDQLDSGMGFCDSEKSRRIASPALQADLQQLAIVIGYPDLAAQLARAFAAFNSGALPVSAAAHMGRTALLLPPSALRKPWLVALGWLNRRRYRGQGRA